jgi:hypothetical protein
MRKARKILEFDPNQIKQLPSEQLVALIVQQQVIEELQQEVERLKLTLQKDSRTSSKPPSTDLLLKPEKTTRRFSTRRFREERGSQTETRRATGSSG